MEAEKTGGGNASPPNDYVIDIHENPLRFYGFCTPPLSHFLSQSYAVDRSSLFRFAV